MTNFDSKGTKWSKNVRATNLGKMFFKKIFFNVNMYEAVENLFITYVWSTLDSLMCCQLYVIILNNQTFEQNISELSLANVFKNYQLPEFLPQSLSKCQRSHYSNKNIHVHKITQNNATVLKKQSGIITDYNLWKWNICRLSNGLLFFLLTFFKFNNFKNFFLH